MNKLLKESKKLSDSTTSNTIENQKQVINFLDIILKKSILKNHTELKGLIAVSKSRLNKDEIIVPFSRKSFIYDLSRIIETLPSKQMQERIILTAQKLPTSSNSTSAYIMKLSNEPPEKILHRLVWPSLASIEHIKPKSCGGEDIMANFGGATTKENSDRKSIPFTDQMKRKPELAKHCQEYVDRLIYLYKNGVFQRCNLSPRYIKDFANTIYEQSNHRIKLNADY